jgi:hypothetical protein
MSLSRLSSMLLDFDRRPRVLAERFEKRLRISVDRTPA